VLGAELNSKLGDCEGKEDCSGTMCLPPPQLQHASKTVFPLNVMPVSPMLLQNLSGFVSIWLHPNGGGPWVKIQPGSSTQLDGISLGLDDGSIGDGEGFKLGLIDGELEKDTVGLDEGVVDWNLDPPHKQHASFTVFEKFSNSFCARTIHQDVSVPIFSQERPLKIGTDPPDTQLRSSSQVEGVELGRFESNLVGEIDG